MDKLNQDCQSVLVQFLTLTEYVSQFSVLNKEYRKMCMETQTQFSQFYWKNQFKIEFGNTAQSFKDFDVQDNESALETFKRAFKLYKEMRVLAKNMIKETLRLKQDDENKYDFISPFNHRKTNENIQFKTLEFDNEVPVQQLTDQMFEIYQVEFYGQRMKTLLLSGSGSLVLQQMYEKYRKMQVLPILHVKQSNTFISQDFNNLCGFGPRAILYLAKDTRKILVIAKSFKEFLEAHVNKLKQNWYMTQRGNIEGYSLNPTDLGGYGSVTITNNVKITAHAYYNHLISQFDSASDPQQKDTYMFSYQIKVSMNPDVDSETEFYKARLFTRTWLIQEGDQSHSVDNQPGVIGMYPEVDRDMEPFIYESQCPTSILGTKMSGHFTFIYLEGPQKGEKFDALIGEFELRLPLDSHLIDSPEGFYN